MNHSDFRIGLEFWCKGRQWRCTDVGSRVIVVIRVDVGETSHLKDGHVTSATITRAEAEATGLFDGPPYRVTEYVFDEYDVEASLLQPYVG